MTLPDFVIAGAQKCGTTQLHNLLTAHPDLFLPRRPQELHFFDLEYSRGRDWYESHFARARPGQCIGQTSPLYLFDPEVPARMHAMLPDSKLVFVLRDPVVRAQSHYWHQVKKGNEDESFQRALDLEPTRILGGPAKSRRYSYASRGQYASQLARFSAWPRSRVSIVLFEDLVRSPESVVDRLCTFLGVPQRGADCVRDARVQTNRAALPRSRRLQQVVRRLRPVSPRLARLLELVNLRPTRYPEMPVETRERLAQMFESPNERLAAEYGLDLSRWTRPMKGEESE